MQNHGARSTLPLFSSSCTSPLQNPLNALLRRISHQVPMSAGWDRIGKHPSSVGGVDLLHRRFLFQMLRQRRPSLIEPAKAAAPLPVVVVDH